MRVENKFFWEDQNVIATQDRSVSSSSNYEVYLYNKVFSFFNSHENLNAKVFGCGTGREIPEVMKYIGIKNVVASDISENMIKKCNENLLKWGLINNVITKVTDAAQFKSEVQYFDVVTFMNNMLTYVTDKEERDKIFKNSYQILNDNGCIIGVVHHKVGTPQKTVYFLLRRFLKPFLKTEVGFRLTGFKGFKFGGHYFSKNEIFNHLKENDFKNIEVISLAEFSKNNNLSYNRLKGYNNLLFFATKR